MKLKHYQEACDGYIQIFMDTVQLKSQVELISSEFLNQIQMAVDRRRTLKLTRLREDRKFAGEKLKSMVVYFDSILSTAKSQVCQALLLTSLFKEEAIYLFDLPSCKIFLLQCL